MNILDGLDPVDPAVIADFIKEMETKTIPEIVRVMHERAEARWRNIYGTEREMHNAWRKRAEEAEAALAARNPI